MVNTRGGGDSPFLLQRMHQLVVNLRAGIFPVRWMPDAAYGLGYPFFSYYAALPYYLVGLLAMMGLDILTALKLVQTLGFIAAALAMYGWMLRLTKNQWAAWLAAVAYTVAPFHLVNVYVRGDSLSEFYAFIFYPLILWALDRIRDSGVAAAALAYAGLILTHIISAMIFSPFALLYLVILAWHEGKKRRWRVFRVGILALGFGLLLSAWYWLPAVAELGHVQLGPSTQDYFHYSRHFRTANLVQWYPLFDYSVSPGGSTPFAMGLVQAVFAALGGLALLTRGSQQRSEARWRFILLGLPISTAMITPLSRLLWDHLPLLSIAQFPWRFLSVQALFTAAATAALAPASFAVHNPQPATRNTQHATRNSYVILIAVLLRLRPLWWSGNRRARCGGSGAKAAASPSRSFTGPVGKRGWTANRWKYGPSRALATWPWKRRLENTPSTSGWDTHRYGQSPKQRRWLRWRCCWWLSSNLESESPN
jgi:hypothetical protein